MRSYDELINLPSFAERLEYLKLDNSIGEETFGFDRYLNQVFYKSKDWQKVRREVILRDSACDLGIEGRELYGKVLIHHINPINPKDISNRNFSKLLDPNNLICVSQTTHNAIHYGDISTAIMDPIERKPNDTSPWKKVNQ